MEDLLWMTFALKAKRSVPRRGPTWSWMCLDGGIYYCDGQLSRTHAAVQNLNFSGESFVDPLWGSVTLSGPVVSARLSYSTPEEWTSRSAIHSFVLEIPESNKEVRDPLFDTDFNFREEGVAHVENGALLFCLRIASLWDGGREVEYSLILRCIEESRGIFERVGALRGETEKSTGQFSRETGPTNIIVSEVRSWPHGMYNDGVEMTVSIT